MTERPAAPPGAGDLGASPGAAVHLVVWVGSDTERTVMERFLAEEGLEPQIEWTTASSVSFRLSTTDAGAVEDLMRRRGQDAAWTLVPPGAPDYVLRYLHVQGPDGRSFRISDVPAAMKVGSVADELMEQYPGRLPGTDRPVIVDRLTSSEGSLRMNRDATLAEEGITEGERLRIGFQNRAG